MSVELKLPARRRLAHRRFDTATNDGAVLWPSQREAYVAGFLEGADSGPRHAWVVPGTGVVCYTRPGQKPKGREWRRCRENDLEGV